MQKYIFPVYLLIWCILTAITKQLYISIVITNIITIIYFAVVTDKTLVIKKIKKVKLKPLLLTLVIATLIALIHRFLIINLNEIALLPISILKLNPNTISNNHMVLLQILCLSPLSEELLCRYNLQNNFKEKFDYKIAIILSSSIFSIMHFSPRFIIAYIMTGIYMGFIYHKTDNLVYPILVHLTINILAIFKNPIIITLEKYLKMNIIIYSILVIATFILINLYKRKGF